jgi:hypothetical protein
MDLRSIYRPAVGLTALALTFSAGATAGAAADTDAAYVKRGERCWADVRVLAHDDLEGRRAGSPGHRRAAEYVALAFKRAGLEPGGDGGWFQKVALHSRSIREENSGATLVGSGGERKLTLGTDAILGLRNNFSAQVDAPLVFAGYGLKLPQYQHDDLAGLDLKGKVVVVFTAAPASVPGAAGAHFGSAIERWKVYREAGAIGVVAILNPYSMDLPWERIAKSRFEPVMALGPPEEDLLAGMQLALTINPANLGVLFEGAPKGADEVLAALKAGQALPRFELPWRIRTTTDAEISTTVSENVIGILPGSDPRLRAEQVVLTAHLDHLGVAIAGDGDRIYNGAMDNASGIAVLMDIAKRFKETKARPKRTVVFAAVTAEESGLLGSRALVSRAQRKEMNVVANLNTDMFLPLFPLKQLVAFGLDESDLGEDIRAIGAQLGVAIQPDPQPLRNRFIRSDQYSFVRAGIPALALKTGFDAGTPESDIEREWFAKRYHAPADDVSQPVDLGSVGKYSDLLERLTLRVANRERAPAWNAASPFIVLRPPGKS